MLSANKRLNTAYVLKESFGQLWSYEREGCAALLRELAGKPQVAALKPYEKFAEMIDRHWDGIAAYCRLENKVSLGFVEGLNNKIRSSSGVPTACATRTIYGSKSSPACYRAIAGHIYPSSTAVSKPAPPRPTRSTHERA